jgi:hypothetical protein
MDATLDNRAGVVKLLLDRGADGSKRTTMTPAVPEGSTALEMARHLADISPEDSAETFAVLRQLCCSACGVTNPGLSAMTVGGDRHLKRCGNCPAVGSSAYYCGEVCQRADWISRHRAECAEARRAHEAAEI